MRTAHPAWGSHHTTQRGEELHNWATHRGLTKIMHYLATTWRRGNKESLLDLAFTNDLTSWSADPLNLARVGSDHDLIAGSISTMVREAHTYSTVDWTWWEGYTEKRTNPAERGLRGINRPIRQTLHYKTATTCSKKWWDKEVQQQLRVTRAAGTGYKEEAKKLKRLIRNNRRSCSNK